MKKVLSILCCIVLLFCVAACGKEPEPAAEPSTESIPVSSNTLISTEPQKPYWDTHEPLSYAGIYNGQRFSGDYEIASYDKTKEGDAYFKLPRLEGKVEDVAQQFLVRKETITDPFLDIYYDKKNNRYVDAWQQDTVWIRMDIRSLILKRQHIITATHPARFQDQMGGLILKRTMSM